MIKLLCFLPIIFFQISLPIYGQTFSVVQRTPKFKAVIKKTNLPDLISRTHFDGKYFKIVQGIESSPISFKSDKVLLLKAATTYYHLNVARKYFVEVVKSERVKNLPQIIVRLDITRQFFELGKFANENLSPTYNTAITIPPGKGFPSRGVGPWDMEIWFRPRKNIHIDELNLRSNNGQVDGLFRVFREQIHMMTFQRFMVSLLNSSNMQSGQLFRSSTQIIGASVLMELFYQFRDPIIKLTSRKHFGMDTALIPEVIYHEFSHVALSDTLALSHESPINEGLADIFSTLISGSSKIATNIKKYNTFNGKKAKRKQDYQVQFENSNFANSDYVLGILWMIKSIVGNEITPNFMYKLSQQINSSSDIRNDLIKGIRKTCDELCKDPFSQKMEIFKGLAKKQM